MTRAQAIRKQLTIGLPESWITDDLVEAVALAIGNQFMGPAPELAEPRHCAAITRYAHKIEEAE